MVKFSKKTLTITTSMFFLLLNFQSNQNVYSFDSSMNGDDTSADFDYYSTSPIEYFNETKHPRYQLVARPINLIISPNKGRPVIAEYNESFIVKINTAEMGEMVTVTTNEVEYPETWKLVLVNSENEIELEFLDYFNGENEGVLTVQPAMNIEGLYDLQFNCSSGDDYQTHSVKIVEKKEYPYKFLHLSDSHFPCYGEINTTDVNLKHIDTIKTLDLDFVIFTGDLIEGGPAWLFVNPEDDKPLAAEIQLRLGLWALDLLDLPVYIIAGNHDLDKSSIIPDNPRKVWENYLGVNPIIQFEYLDWKYVGYSVTKEGLSSSQYDVVKEMIGEIDRNNVPCVMFYHSNYANQASDLRKLFSIEVMLYGHEHDERLYTKENTLYHCEAPMFENRSSIFTVINGTNMILKEKEYNFSVLLQETSKTSLSSFILCSVCTIMVILLVRRRKAK